MMGARKSASLKGLFFRELYIGRRTYIAVTSIFFGFILLVFLVLLSMKVGNLAKLPEDVLQSASGTIRMFGIFVPAALFFMNTSVVVDTAPNDYTEKWTRFLYSSPVSESKFFFVKYMMMLAVAVIGYGLSAVNGVIVGELMGKPIAYSDFAVMASIMLVIVFMATLITILSYWFKSTTYAVVIVLILGYLGMMFLMFASGVMDENAPEDETVFLLVGDKVSEISEAILPFSPLVLIAIVALGWAVTTFVMKHRDMKPPKFFSKKEKPVNKV